MDPDQLPLRDLHLPDPVGWWPLAAGWWVLIALAAAGLVYLAYLQFTNWRHNSARRLALRELGRLRRDYQSGADAIALSKELSELVRRSMLAYAPRREVAGLTGETWLKWLDRGLPGEPFCRGSGRNLEFLPYQKEGNAQEDNDIAGLIEAVHRRLKTPLPEGSA